jgi:hypothetical protein
VTVRAVIFNYRTLFPDDTGLSDSIRECLNGLAALGVKICVFTTDPMNIAEAMSARGYPPPTCVLNKSDARIGVNRGSPKWVDAVVDELHIQNNELLYIGSSKWDWITAVNSGVIYAHAGWTGRQPGGTTSLTVDHPLEILTFIRHFLLVDDRWSFSLDDSARKLRLRALLPASAKLPSTKPSSSFKLQDVFTYKNEVFIGPSTARNLLMLHALTSLYAEGVTATRSFFCVYPSSQPGTVSEQLEGYLRYAVSIFGSSYKSDLLVRSVAGVDTSIARVRRRQGLDAPEVSIANQASTVIVNERYRGKLANKTVIVFDDFTTSGMSLEWARHLLLAAGAANVILLTIGKYGSRYDTYDLKPGRTINPFAISSLKKDDFVITSQWPTEDGSVEATLSDLFASWIQENGAA